jgi:hypothetical protein
MAGSGTDVSIVGSTWVAGVSRTASVASAATAGAKPPARSYSCSTFETDVIVSMIVGSLNIRSDATSYTFSGSWGASRSITPTLGKSKYQHVASSITSSAMRATRVEEVSATSAVGGGPETPTSGKGSDTSTT